MGLFGQGRHIGFTRVGWFLDHRSWRIPYSSKGKFPAELWQRHCAARNLAPAAQAVITQDYHADASGKVPRYYQQIAVNRSLEAIYRFMHNADIPSFPAPPRDQPSAKRLSGFARVRREVANYFRKITHRV